MSRIVILQGSPRQNGNTARLVQAFAEGARRNNQVDIIRVTEYEIHPCTGCGRCFELENRFCAQMDDEMQQIYPILARADVIVAASPVYFYGISAQLKTLVDRLHTPKRSTFQTKKLGLLLVGASHLPELFDSIQTQYNLICRFFHLEDAGQILVRGVKEPGDIEGRPELEQAFEMGKQIL